jgi:hypothetical protein
MTPTPSDPYAVSASRATPPTGKFNAPIAGWRSATTLTCIPRRRPAIRCGASTRPGRFSRAPGAGHGTTPSPRHPGQRASGTGQRRPAVRHRRVLHRKRGTRHGHPHPRPEATQDREPGHTTMPALAGWGSQAPGRWGCCCWWRCSPGSYRLHSWESCCWSLSGRSSRAPTDSHATRSGFTGAMHGRRAPPRRTTVSWPIAPRSDPSDRATARRPPPLPRRRARTPTGAARSRR